MGERVTKEWLIETYGITDEDTKDVDLDLFLNETGWTIEEAKNYDTKEKVINRVVKWTQANKERQEALALNDDLTYLFEGGICDGTLPEVTKLKRIALESPYFKKRSGENDPEGYVSALADLENGMLYFAYYRGNWHALSQYNQMEEKIKLETNDVEEIYRFFQKARIETWTEKDASEQNWHIGFEYEDGTYYTYEIFDGENALQTQFITDVFSFSKRRFRM